MKAIVIREPGGIDKLEYCEVPDPVAGPGEVVIDIAFASANWSDVQKRQGVYPNPVSYPAILGCEVSGHIIEVGEGVEGLHVGQRVAAMTNYALVGGYAEFCKVEVGYVIPLTDDISLETAAAAPLVSMTAYHMLFSAYDLQPGETILIHAIGGAVGLTLTQLAKAHGATVIGTVSGPGKGDKALAYGADLIIDRSKEDFVEATLTFTKGQKIDLVLDSLGADILPRSFDVLRTYGRVINFGEAAGYPNFDFRPKLYENSTSLAGFELLQVMRTKDRWQIGCRDVVKAIESGALEIPIEKVFEFEEVHAMHQKLESRTVSGKLLLKGTPAD